MSREIFVVSKLWTDSLENYGDRAIGYEPVGFIFEGEESSIKIKMINPDCWAAFGEQVPDFKLTKLKHVND